jgi:hypothetical protein
VTVRVAAVDAFVAVIKEVAVRAATVNEAHKRFFIMYYSCRVLG